MELVDLVLIKSEENEQGVKIFRRLDNNKTLFEDEIEILKEPPVLLRFDPVGPINPTIKMNHKDYVQKANALLLGRGLQEQDDDYYPASYCRIK
jgi:hypothetical protein